MYFCVFHYFIIFLCITISIIISSCNIKIIIIYYLLFFIIIYYFYCVLKVVALAWLTPIDEYSKSILLMITFSSQYFLLFKADRWKLIYTCSMCMQSGQKESKPSSNPVVLCITNQKVGGSVPACSSLHAILEQNFLNPGCSVMHQLECEC